MAGPSDDKLVGRSLPGGYHILELISVGGMGRVYRAEQSVLGRTVAVKIVHPHLLWDENSAARFLTEARAASKLNHPNSISVFDFGRTDDGQPYLVMEYLRGKDLARVAYEEGPMSPSRIVDVLRQVLAALAEAHELGIVHRDLKPENIFLEPLRRGGDFVKVLDFGLAKLKADAAAPSVTSPGIVCGTPDYMSPEQGRGDPLDGRSDLYAVGVILFQLLTGRLPFEADSPTAVVMMHLTLPVPDPRHVAPEREIPQPLVEVLFRSLRKEADRRYQDAIEFAEALGQALAMAQSSPARLRSTVPPTSSLVPRSFLMCGACGFSVPEARFCCECGAPMRLPSQPAEGRLVSLQFVGRDEDLAWLLGARKRLGTTVLGVRVAGEPGAGKTRLLEEFLLRAEAEGDRIVRVGPDPYWAELPCYTLRGMIPILAQLSERDLMAGRFEKANVDARRGLEEILAGVPRSDDKRTPIERRQALTEALRWAVERGSEVMGATRVIVAVDELHRVDGPSRYAMAELLADPPQGRVLFVGAHVPGFDPGWGPEDSVRVLGPVQGAHFVRSTRRTRVSDVLRAVRDIEILPLYADQLIRHATEVGGDPPRRLADLIAQRVEVLEPNARLALQALTVLGDEVEPAWLARLLPKSLDLEATLKLLEGAGLIVSKGATVSTAHPLLRELVFASIPAAARRELHARALGAWEKRGAPLEVRALHAYYAQDSFRALLLLEQAADRAGMLGDTPSEVLALRRGLELSRQEISRGELDDPLGAILIFGRKLGTALIRAGDFADAEGVLREALDVAGPNSADRARVLGALAHVAQGRRRPAEALGYIDQAIEAARTSGAKELLGTLTDTRTAWLS